MPSREELLGYLLGALDASDQELVEYHLQQFPELESELHELKACMEPLGQLDAFEHASPPGLARRTIEQVARVARDPSYRIEFSGTCRPSPTGQDLDPSSRPVLVPAPTPSPAPTPLLSLADAGTLRQAHVGGRSLRHISPQRVVLLAISALAVSLSFAPLTANTRTASLPRPTTQRTTSRPSSGESNRIYAVADHRLQTMAARSPRPGSGTRERLGQDPIPRVPRRMELLAETQPPTLPALPPVPPLSHGGRSCRVTWIPDAALQASSVSPPSEPWSEPVALWPQAKFPQGLSRLSPRPSQPNWGLSQTATDLIVHGGWRN